MDGSSPTATLSAAPHWVGSGRRLALLAQLPTDVDLLLPVAERCQAASGGEIVPRLYLAERLPADIPWLPGYLNERRITWQTVSPRRVEVGDEPSLEFTAALLTATDTTAEPHRAAHALTRRANRLGIPTFTMQHGLESIGLTWFDEMYRPATVDFASRWIFSWGMDATLDPRVRPDVRRRIVPVGCPEKPRWPNRLPKRGEGRPMRVLVCENLHWSRYDAAYRRRFLDDLIHAARSLPDWRFFIKPHPAGQWLTRASQESWRSRLRRSLGWLRRPWNWARFQERGGPSPRWRRALARSPNVTLFSPTEGDVRGLSASNLIAQVDAVITTPSTVALDAARLNSPVAVAGYGLSLDRYAPLSQLDSARDWIAFLEATRRPDGRGDQQALAAAFRERNLLPGDATGRILRHIMRACGHPNPTVSLVS